MGDGLTTEEIAERQWKPAWFIHDVLHDEARRGNVVLVGDRWQASASLVASFGSAFAYLGREPVRKRRRP